VAPSWERASTPSLSAVSCQRLRGTSCGAGAVSQRKRSSAAAIAAASSGDADELWICICGRGGLCFPFRPGKLILHPEADVCIRRGLGHPGPFQLDRIRAQMLEKPDPLAEDHGDDAHLNLVGHPGP
jgi:hypothetical protein